MYRRFGKRLFDLVLSVPALFALAPLMGIVAVAVRIVLGRGVLYRDQRPGMNAKPHTLYKFRTMNNARDEQGELLPDGQRLTGFGRFLRRFSLDELPQLWNVVRGELSLVGPRPLVMRYLPRYSAEQMRRHEVRPGLTGWAQINGRNAISWEEKFTHDIWYVDHLNFILDLKILMRTIWLVLRQANVSASGHATMPEFKGSQGADRTSDDRRIGVA